MSLSSGITELPVSEHSASAYEAARARTPAAASTARVRPRSWLSPLAGLLLTAATIHYVDASAVLARIFKLRFGYILLGGALALPQLYCLAARWRLTAAQLGVQLSQRRALREYALSMLLNQLLPLGVAGDAIRVVRHARGGRTRRTLNVTPFPAARSGGLPYSTALYGVLLERLMGQLVVIVWALAALPLWFGSTGIWLAGAALASMLLLARVLRRLPVPADVSARPLIARAVLRLAAALQRLLARPRFLFAQFWLSTAVVLGLVAQLYCALCSLGLSLPLAHATQVFPLMLLSMSLPFSFAGFGPREAVTAQLYSALSLSAADGTAFAMATGAVMLCASLPCLLLVLSIPRANAELTP